MADTERLRLEKLETLLAVNRELALELNLDKLLELIASVASQIMGADRSRVYVVDRKRNELWSRIAQGVDEIRMPLDRGIAGRVATSGELLNVSDAYQMDEFDPQWDQKHGYTTRKTAVDETGERMMWLDIKVNDRHLDKKSSAGLFLLEITNCQRTVLRGDRPTQ